MKEIIKYPNGFTLVYEHSKQQLPIASLYAYIRVGSINENDSNRGASHFIEHMCFKGTKKIKNPSDLFTEYNKTSEHKFNKRDGKHSVLLVQIKEYFSLLLYKIKKI